MQQWIVSYSPQIILVKKKGDYITQMPHQTGRQRCLHAAPPRCRVGGWYIYMHVSFTYFTDHHNTGHTSSKIHRSLCLIWTFPNMLHAMIRLSVNIIYDLHQWFSYI